MNIIMLFLKMKNNYIKQQIKVIMRLVMIKIYVLK